MASWHYLCLVLEWAQVQKIMRGIASDLDHIHTRATPAIIHGDLKPDNILLGQPLKWLESWFRPYKKMLEGVLFDMRSKATERGGRRSSETTRERERRTTTITGEFSAVLSEERKTKHVQNERREEEIF
ncbi:PTI1-like tyrosine-protein kinase At3g15890 isoform X2 [Camellia sinensis]|uniref:PTI1-like tyrosine-protein kinase At3g15890 isoform X2 n=1 Tax=Camellia sinensis TaxID=4442 RepID=UPI0010355402|nr:PTI1-like tyrosine-protein kinase At3g15890 isoform X2 [Camellia sinensis]